jgi:lipopolysaccharide biosynthesis glycosyltransferase
MKIFIQSNKFQYTAAKVAKFSFERFGYTIEIVNFEEHEILTKRIGEKYLRKGKIKIFKNDLQSFTLLRFLIPQLAKPNDKIAIIDPDVFALQPLNKLQEITNVENKIFCTFYNGIPRSEVMIGKAKNFYLNFNQLIYDLFELKIDYDDIMSLRVYKESELVEIPQAYNQHDQINNGTFILHTTNRISQPWKLGLKIDFDRHLSSKTKIINYLKKYLFFPYNKSFVSNYYIKHESKEVYNLILELFKEAVNKNYINKSELEKSVQEGFVGINFFKDLTNIID